MNVESIRNNRRAFLEQLSLHFLINQTHKRALTRTHTGNTDDSMRYFKSKGLMFDIYVRRDKNGTTQIPINGRGENGEGHQSLTKTQEKGLDVSRRLLRLPPHEYGNVFIICGFYYWGGDTISLATKYPII